ncbi:MAG TPA: hypothetical protein VL068_01860, partial [Microthrixaceae bacterium]|nr:hypothetical protein [Microthrixaceae bacterium]
MSKTLKGVTCRTLISLDRRQLHFELIPKRPRSNMDDQLKDILKSARTIAVYGASTDPTKAA